MFCTWCCKAHRFHVPRHFFTHYFGEQVLLHDKSNSTKPLTFDIRLRYMWGNDRLVIMDPLRPEKVRYKIVCQTKDYCHILGWRRNPTEVTILASIDSMAWYPKPTPDDPKCYQQDESDDAVDAIKSKALLKQPLLMSSKLFDEVFNITFIPSQKKYTFGYGARHIVAEVNNFDRSTPQHQQNEDYSLQIFEDINLVVDPVFLLSMCIMIDYIEWPHYMSRT